MKAFVVGRYGSKEGVRMREVPEPDVGAHDVLVEVRAASVNGLDAKIRDGEFKRILPYRVPFVLGNDLAGVVVREGSAVRSFASGDEVYARPGTDHIGTFAELAAVYEDDLAVKPATLTMEESAALPLVALTACQALVERANLRPVRRSWSTRSRVVWGRSRSSSPGTSARTSRRRRARPTPGGSRTSALTWSSTTSATTSRPSCTATTWFSTASAGRRWRSPCACSDQAASPSAWPARPTPRSRKTSAPIPSSARDGAAQRPDEAAGPATPRAVLVLVHEGQRRAAPRDRRLADAGAIRPVIDRVVPFDSTKDAMAYVESGRAKGKVVVTMADLPPGRPVLPPAAHARATLTEIPSTERHGRD